MGLGFFDSMPIFLGLGIGSGRLDRINIILGWDSVDLGQEDTSHFISFQQAFEFIGPWTSWALCHRDLNLVSLELNGLNVHLQAGPDELAVQGPFSLNMNGWF